MVPPDRYTPDLTPPDSQLSPTESTIMQMLGDWLKTNALPAGWELYQGQQNRLPTPAGPFLIMQTISRRTLATPRHDYGPAGITISQPVDIGLQLTAYGDGAVTVLGSIAMLWRDGAAVHWFCQRRNDMAPASTGTLTQHSFTSAEQQYEDCASLTLQLATEIRLHHNQQTATALALASLTEADTAARPFRDWQSPLSQQGPHPAGASSHRDG